MLAGVLSIKSLGEKIRNSNGFNVSLGRLKLVSIPIQEDVHTILDDDDGMQIAEEEMVEIGKLRLPVFAEGTTKRNLLSNSPYIVHLVGDWHTDDVLNKIKTRNTSIEDGEDKIPEDILSSLEEIESQNFSLKVTQIFFGNIGKINGKKVTISINSVYLHKKTDKKHIRTNKRPFIITIKSNNLDPNYFYIIESWISEYIGNDTEQFFSFKKRKFYDLKKVSEEIQMTSF